MAPQDISPPPVASPAPPKGKNTTATMLYQMSLSLLKLEEKLDALLEYQRKEKRHRLISFILWIIAIIVLVILPLYFAYVVFNNIGGLDVLKQFSSLGDSLESLRNTAGPSGTGTLENLQNSADLEGSGVINDLMKMLGQ